MVNFNFTISDCEINQDIENMLRFIYFCPDPFYDEENILCKSEAERDG